MLVQPEPVEKFVTSIAEETWGLFRKSPLVLVLSAAVATLLSALTLGIMAGALTVGFIDLVRKVRADEPAQLGDVFGRFDALLPGLIAVLLVALAASLGFMLLVVPGLLALIFSAFALHVIAFEHATAIAAIKRSVQLVKAHFLNVLVVLVLVSVLQALGGAVLFGMLLSVPLGLIAITLTYERLAHTGAVLSE